MNRLLDKISIHHSYYTRVRRGSWGIAGLVLLVFVSINGLPAIVDTKGLASYAWIHLLLELFSIVCSLMVFMVIWSNLEQESSAGLTLASVCFLGVALLDISHSLSFVGMPVFITPNSPEKAIHFWLGARTLSIIAIFVILFLPRHIQLSKWSLKIFVFGVLSYAFTYNWVVVRHISWLPKVFIEGSGLTAFKIYYEYFLISMALLAAAALLWRMKQRQSFDIVSLFQATCIMALSEFLFTLYSDVTDIYNFLGHIYKVIAYACIYRAIFVSSLKDPYKVLEQLHSKQQAILQALPDLVFEVDHSGRFLEVYASDQAKLYQAAEAFIGKTFGEVMPPHIASLGLKAIAEAQLNGHSRSSNYELEIENEIKYFDMTAVKKQILPDESQRFIILIHDLSALIKSQNALVDSQNELLESQRIAELGSYRFDFRNQEWTSSAILDELFGINQDYDRSFKGWTDLIHPDDKERMSRYFLNEVSKNKTDFNAEYRILRPEDNKIIWVHGLGKLVFDHDGEIISMQGTIQDITEYKQTQKRIEWLAHFDQLTGLPNRVLLEDRVNYMLSLVKRQNEKLVLMFLDLDHFKSINDTLGHTIGDQLLVEVALRLRSIIRDEDTVARYGGDEFIFMFPNTDNSHATQIAQKIISAISHPFTIDHNELNLTASIGISIYPHDGADFETLLRNADTAMYRIKNAHRNNYSFFTPAMQAQSIRQHKVYNALKDALNNQEFSLQYQPQISLADNTIVGTEVLLRWSNPALGQISPNEFIPIIEQSGQIIEIGEWAIKTAVNQLSRWFDAGIPKMILATNISAVQFNQINLSQNIATILDQANFPYELFELELTEAAAMEDPESARDIMQQLNKLGIRFSIDDFGTGYSSLSYLKRFNLYKLKIDKSFVDDLHTNTEDQNIVKTIINMAKALGLKTIAEGVEKEAQLQFLQENGCDEVQGFFYSTALPANEFEVFVNNWQSHNHPESKID